MPAFAFCTLNARADWAAAHRAELAALLKAVRTGVDVFTRDGARITALLAKKLKMPADLARRGAESFRRRGIFDRDLDLSRDALAGTVDALRRSGLDQAADVGVGDVMVAT